MKTRIPMPIDGKAITTDWIYEDLANGNYATDEMNGSECAFYLSGVLWIAKWNYAGGYMRLIAPLTRATKEDVATMEARLHNILDHSNGDDLGTLVCETESRHSDGRAWIKLCIYRETNE